MYVMAPPRTLQRPPSSTARTKTAPFPTYDVKIIAGRRVVIFHDRNATDENNQKGQEQNKPLDSDSLLPQQVEQQVNANNEVSQDGLNENDQEDKMIAVKASSVPSSRSSTRTKTSTSVPPHPNYHNGRRLSLTDSFTVKSFEEHSRYPVLPPLTKSREATQEDIDARVEQSISGVSERALQVMLREMRTKDRDRDGCLRPDQIESYMDRFNVPIQGVLSHLQTRFSDQKFEGMTNYEDLLRYLTKMKLKEVTPNQPDQQNQQQAPPKTATRSKRQMSSKKASSTFEDRGEARLILDLESAISNSPKFDLDVFKSCLESKDMYGNEQVSKQHVIQAANNSKLQVPREVLSRWLIASDPINRGIYSIPKLVNFLMRSQPNVIERVKTAKLSKSHGNLSYGRSPEVVAKKPEIEFPSLVSAEKKNDKATETMSPRPQNLQDLSYLKQALVRSHQEVPGYLSADDVRHVCTSYSAAFQMNISPARIQEAIGKARSMDPVTNLINIGLFCRFLDETLKH